MLTFAAAFRHDRRFHFLRHAAIRCRDAADILSAAAISRRRHIAAAMPMLDAFERCFELLIDAPMSALFSRADERYAFAADAF